MSFALQEAVTEIEQTVRGRLAFCLYDLKIGQMTSHRVDETVATASTYKFPLLFH